MLALEVDHEHDVGGGVDGAETVEVLEEPLMLAADHGLLLLDVLVHRAVRLHALNFLHALHGALDGLEVGQGAAEPALGDEGLAAGLGRFLDGFLGLLLGADEEDVAALGRGSGEEFAGFFHLNDRLGQVDDVDAVAGLEDESLHLGVPATGLMAEMNACFEEFFDSDGAHVVDTASWYWATTLARVRLRFPSGGRAGLFS